MDTEANSCSTDLRVASFSCYLKPHEDKLNVFGVDKFSGMETGYQDVLPKEVPLDLHQIKSNVFTARTPNISSGGSSWNNSQSMLLRRNSAQAKQNGKAFGKRFFHGFHCPSPCSTKKAVYVNEMGSYGTKGDQFAFPVLNPAMEILTAKQKQFEEAPRKSLEVFGSGTMTKGDIVKNLERKMSILTWDAIPKANDEFVSMTYKNSAICDDMASEASSDLFEIENISRSGSFASCIMSPSTQYAPSEASIEWSVITASAAEFSSGYSDYDEKRTVYTTSTSQTTAKNKTGMGKKAPKIHPAGLLGCKSHQSVKVTESVYRTTNKSKH